MSYSAYTIIHVEPRHNPNEGRIIINNNFDGLSNSIDSLALSTSGASGNFLPLSGGTVIGNTSLFSSGSTSKLEVSPQYVTASVDGGDNAMYISSMFAGMNLRGVGYVSIINTSDISVTAQPGIIIANKTSGFTSGLSDETVVSIASQSTTFNQDVKNSVAIGLSNGIVDQSDTVFVNNLKAVNQLSGKTLTLQETSNAPLNLPIFTANPGAPINGDTWILSAVTGNAILSIQIGGVTKTIELT